MMKKNSKLFEELSSDLIGLAKEPLHLASHIKLTNINAKAFCNVWLYLNEESNSLISDKLSLIDLLYIREWCNYFITDQLDKKEPYSIMDTEIGDALHSKSMDVISGKERDP